ncbi:hypothetical protein [Salipiger abyssi]|uniref:ArsR family transcriptional regulator n=1 Tax=Salipiger abyssi TaxID=1250539 RepID=A0A1P8UXM4_9RHOB|nr:hypothetical protein [Salipiger abyssi]ALF02118.1 hypothetical protein vBPeaSP1_027 [Pelagibaca phage vB_PeaS-P1]APZ54133.1 hypothetical protein Ga0080574_TMP3799 [Salipiger abyssi]
MSDYLEKRVKPIRRAIILGFLERSKAYTSNADILMSVINGTPDGVTAYYSEVVEDLRWLEEKGYVVLNGLNTIVVEATPAGRRIARRENVDPGIARDTPEV